MTTIPASEIVNVVGSVLSAGGVGLNGTGLMLTTNSRIPIGTVANFANQPAVKNYFGQASYEGDEAGIYFAGFAGADIAPSSLLMAQYNLTDVAAYLRGGNASGLTLAQLQAITGTLDITVDGYARSIASVNLAAATSFSAAAALLQTAFNASPATLASATASIAASTADFTASIEGNVMTVTAVTSGTIVNGGALSGTGVSAGTLVGSQLSGTTGGIGTYSVSISQNVASGALTESYGTLDVTVIASGTLSVGQTVAGTGVTTGTIITAPGTGTGTTGTYYVNLSQTVASEAVTTEPTPVAVSYDSTSGGFVITSGIIGTASTVAYATGTAAANLFMTSATGAVLSQGANAATPSAFMGSLISTNSAWVNFMTIFDPDGGFGNTQKQAFAAWKNTALGGNRFCYVAWDPDASPSTQNPATSSLGYILKNNGDSGTLPVWEGAATEDDGLAAFALGVAASTQYGATAGRTTLAFRQQAGLVANVSDPTTASNLLGNGYNFYGAYGAANQNFIWYQTGQITGPYAWFDSFQNQVWLNTLFQIALLTLFTNVKSIPFSQAGASLIDQTLQSIIAQGLAFGAFGPDTLSAATIAAVNADAGANIAPALQSQGWYLLINIPGDTVRAARGPWPIKFYYIDQECVQSIDLSSIAVQ